MTCCTNAKILGFHFKGGNLVDVFLNCLISCSRLFLASLSIYREAMSGPLIKVPEEFGGWHHLLGKKDILLVLKHLWYPWHTKSSTEDYGRRH